MIAATLRALTWGTVATAVVSALLLAVNDDSVLHAARDRSASTRGTATPPTPRPAPVRRAMPASPARSDLGDSPR